MNLTIIGHNSAGLTGKSDSLKRLIQVKNPGIIMLQETKMKKNRKITVTRLCYI